MALYKETGTNPFASCLPLILQMPIFIALFQLINHASKGETRGVMTPTLADQFAQRDHPRRARSPTASPTPPTSPVQGPGRRAWWSLMCATTFLTQRQLMSKNMPADAMTGQYAQQQKMLLYVLPVVFAVGGIAFPIGVLFYWTTSNLWTMGQQFYVIRNNPAPGTPAAKAKQERDAAKRSARGCRTRARRSSRSPRTSRVRHASRAEAPAAQEAEPQPAKEAGPAQQRRRTSPASQTRATNAGATAPDPSPRQTSRHRRGRSRDRADLHDHRHRRGPDGPHPPTPPSRRRPKPTTRLTSRDELGGRTASRTRATSPPTTSRSCSTSPTSTATSTWTSRATAPR